MRKGASRVAAAMVSATAVVAIACGGAPKGEPVTSSSAAPAGASAATADGSAAASGSDGGAAAAQTTGASDAAARVDAAPAHPFAKTTEEATSLIDEAINTRGQDLVRCVQEARARRKDVHAKIQVEIGIDQEGTLIGVETPKGQTRDKVLNKCVQDALYGAPFPKSHAGVITVKRTFEDTVIYR